MTHSFESDDEPDIDSVWLWYEFQVALLGTEHRRIVQILQAGVSIDGEGDWNSSRCSSCLLLQKRFFGQSSMPA
jgi:hypothetical protein